MAQGSESSFYPLARLLVKLTCRVPSQLSQARAEHPDEIPQLAFTLLEQPTLLRQVRRSREERLSRERERAYLPAWFCNHCYDLNQNGPATLDSVHTHLREMYVGLCRLFYSWN